MIRLMTGMLLLTLCSAAMADDAYFNSTGTVQRMGKSTTVRMVRETVNIQLGGDGAEVRCTFLFKNEGKAETVRIGFPEKKDGTEGPQAFASFKSWVDGKPMKVSYKRVDGNDNRGYRAWYFKDVPFAAGQMRTVVDHYTANVGGDSMGGREFQYILATGATWKGKIGEASVTIDAREAADRYNFHVDGFKKHGRIYTATLKNFEPDEGDDIDIQMTPKYILAVNSAPAYMPSSGSDFDVRNGVILSSVRELTYRANKPIAWLTWDRAKGRCVVSYHDKSLAMTLGSKNAILNNSKTVQLPAAPELYYGNVYVPVEAVGRALGAKVWRHWYTGDTVPFADMMVVEVQLGVTSANGSKRQR